ncbi:MAG: PEP-CTERM sorting domain-containing protein [Candidatus Omnitrophica bacterium]|nr:PEP-CTERM sorting domain-containing protein [Candidatus Omnitrophota bacterium]
MTLDNGASDVFNHAIMITDVPRVTIDGIQYREFLLDINQNASDNPSLLSLDEIQIFLSGTANQSVETFTGGILDLTDASLVYRLDAGSDSWIKMNYTLNHGSGSGDMFAYIPETLFANVYTGSNKFVYLYSRFGENHVNNDGFEEWAVREGGGPEPGPDAGPTIPEPTSLFLMGTGLLSWLGARRLRLVA